MEAEKQSLGTNSMNNKIPVPIGAQTLLYFAPHFTLKFCPKLSMVNAGAIISCSHPSVASSFTWVLIGTEEQL